MADLFTNDLDVILAQGETQAATQEQAAPVEELPGDDVILPDGCCGECDGGCADDATLVERLATFDGTMGFLSERINPVVAKPPAYPFVGQKAVKGVLERDQEVRLATVAMLYHLQTSQEQADRDTEVRNKAGFMSSDAWWGSKIGEALRDGELVSPEMWDKVDKIAVKYARQLTTQLRRVAMVADPKLASYAATFSVR